MEILNRDMLIFLGLEMELPDLLNFCKSSSRINEKVCKDNNLWLSKLRKEFPNENFLENMKPKERYITLYSLRDVKEKLGIKESLEELYNSEILFIRNKNLTAIPASIGYLSNLKSLYLNNNSLKKLPSSIGNLTNLGTLDLSYNKLKEIPTSIGNLTNLERLDLSVNSIKKLPESIGNLSNLQNLILYNNSLKELPESIGNLSNLQNLNLYNNLVKIKIPPSLTNNRKLNIYQAK